MSALSVARKLAVIIHADVAASTALVQRNEALAHTRIGDAFQRFSAIIDDYGGTVHEIRGDALVAEFARASDAASAVLRFQRSNAEHNAGHDDAVKPELRVGISLGEAIFDQRTVTGTGVVLAQRVEQLADPGSVCITSAVHEAIPDRMPFRLQSIGERELKGFNEPVRVYRLTMQPGAEIPAPEPLRSSTPPTARRVVLAIVLFAIVAVTIASAYRWLLPPHGADRPPGDGSMSAGTDRPSIAVLPFDNLNADPQQDYFSDGITDDLITELSKVSGLFVISRNSTFVYKGRAGDVKRIALDLGVRYVLEGSVRRAADRVRINAQLIDARSGGHLWAERYDGALDDVFGLQDRVTRDIVTALTGELAPGSAAAALLKDTSVMAAYDAFLKGWGLQLRKTPEDAATALQYLQQAVQLDPRYGRAYAAMAQIYWDYSLNATFNRRIGQHTGQTMVDKHPFTAWELLAKARGQPSSQFHALLAHMLQRQRRFPEAMREARRALELGPSDPTAHDALIELLIYAGKAEEAIAQIDASIGLDPNLPGEKLFLKALAYYAMAQSKDALPFIERARAHNPDQIRYSVIEAAVLDDLGRLDEARAAFELHRQRLEILETSNWFEFSWPFQSRDTLARLTESMRALGAIASPRSISVSPRERLGDHELKALIASRLTIGVDRGPHGLEAEFEITRDGDAQIVEQDFLTYFRVGTGRTEVRDDLLCDPWWEYGDYCVAVYRNPEGSRDSKNEYIFFTLTSPFTFSVFDRPG